MSNAWIPEPEPSGPWVDSRRCSECGELYRDFRSGSSFAEAAQRVRSAARTADDWTGDPREHPGGYRSRGAILWAWRVIKIERWYLHHRPCGHEWAELRDGELVDGDGRTIF